MKHSWSTYHWILNVTDWLAFYDNVIRNDFAHFHLPIGPLESMEIHTCARVIDPVAPVAPTGPGGPNDPGGSGGPGGPKSKKYI